MKQCAKCKEIKPLCEFYKKTAHKDGLSSQCKTCLNETSRKYQQRPEVKKRRLEADRKWQQRPEVKKRRREADLYRVRKDINEVTDNYIKKLFRGNCKLKNADVTPEMIELKREQILMHREKIKIKRRLKDGIISSGN